MRVGFDGVARAGIADLDDGKETMALETRRNFLQSAAALGLAAALPTVGQTAPLVIPGKLRFGVNYTPRRKWWYCWEDWDQQAVLDDLEGIAGLGMDHIRAQCLWPIFEPGINAVNERAIEHLHGLLEAADRCGLDVEVTVLNGWMSGLSFLPAWTAPLARPERGNNWNLFTSPEVLTAQKLLFGRIAQSAGEHRRFMGFDIGNELGVLMTGANAVSAPQADAWAKAMLATCSELAPKRFHVNGADHSHWFADFGFSRAALANTGSATAIHSYIYFDGVLDRFAYDSPQARHLAIYEVELATAYQLDPARPVWVEEIGVGDKEMPVPAKPDFMRHTVHNLAEAGNLWGITWWCSHDIDRGIHGFNDYEYTLGLLDLKNHPKPLGTVFSELARELRSSRVEAETARTALVIPDAGLTARPWPSDWRYASAWMRLMAQGRMQGKRPAIVLESRAGDAGYLWGRGIAELIPLSGA